MGHEQSAAPSDHRPLAARAQIAACHRRAGGTLFVGLLTLAIPELQAVRGELLTLLITLALAIIGGYSLEDAAQAGRERSAVPAEELRELVKGALSEFVDELADRQQEAQRQ